uniref:Epidermal patterning factor-like protein n=1 Tax=Kalanchoe fedtschenkoi TaxID=63787 RepID=A0A7N0TH28_KALFE
MELRHQRFGSFSYKTNNSRHGFRRFYFSVPFLVMFFFPAVSSSPRGSAITDHHASCFRARAEAGVIKLRSVTTLGREASPILYQKNGMANGAADDERWSVEHEADISKSRRGNAMVEMEMEDTRGNGLISDARLIRRELISGPGSYQPRCMSKCGRCNPCKPVHVAVPPGMPVTAEYYPEAWRCKCGNRLYMP